MLRKLIESHITSEIDLISRLYQTRNTILTHIVRRGESNIEWMIKEKVMRGAAKHIDEEISHRVRDLESKLEDLRKAEK